MPSTGNLVWPQEGAARPDRASNVWIARDVPLLAEALDAEPVMVVAAESDPPGGPIPLPVTVAIPNDHLSLRDHLVRPRRRLDADDTPVAFAYQAPHRLKDPYPLMLYVSTRGTAPRLGFEEAMLAGLARDGGLYVPESWPTMTPAEIAALAGLPYPEAAFRVMRPFVADAFPEPEFRAILARAYAGFRHPAVAPLVQLGPNDWLLELHHGPTLAFKDVAMQLIGGLFEASLKRSGRRITIVGATSGDTGSAAIEAFRGREGIEVFILFPDGRVSEVQRRQMTTAAEANVHALAIAGDFDDAQARVKDMFNDHAFRDGVGLAGVNSINWARVLAQTVYYFTSAVALGAPHRPVSFTVPTGNFGDIFAGWVAKRMGLPIDRLVIATNQNDILHRTLETGEHRRAGVRPSISPSMDIEVSSNFERLLFELTTARARRWRN